MKHFFVMRFSCFVNPARGDIGRNGFSNLWYRHIVDKNNKSILPMEERVLRYKEYLYSEERMNVKFKAFSELFLPSLLSKNKDKENWELLIFITDKHMPEKYTKRLRDLVEGINQIKIIKLKSDPYCDNEFLDFVDDKCSSEDKWSVISVADDDGINPNHLHLLEEAATKNSEPFIYTMPVLDTVSLDENGDFTYGDKFTYWSIHGLAMTGVGINPLRLGAHYKIPENHPELKIVTNREQTGGILFCDEKHTASCRSSNSTHSQTFVGPKY